MLTYSMELYAKILILERIHSLGKDKFLTRYATESSWKILCLARITAGSSAEDECYGSNRNGQKVLLTWAFGLLDNGMGGGADSFMENGNERLGFLTGGGGFFLPRAEACPWLDDGEVMTCGDEERVLRAVGF